VKVRYALGSRKHEPKARVSIVRWNLKEAGGKVPDRRTETVYKAVPDGRACLAKQSPMLPESGGVNAAVRWDESYRPLPGEVWTIGGGKERQSPHHNPCSDVWLNVRKSAWKRSFHGHSTVKGDVPCRGRTNGAGRAEHGKNCKPEAADFGPPSVTSKLESTAFEPEATAFES
jgi:hypothetical protein